VIPWSNQQNWLTALMSSKQKRPFRYLHREWPVEWPAIVTLLQKSAVEHLTTYRQVQARDFGSVATIVTTDFEALYAYKCGDYQRCLLLSTQNVKNLLNAAHLASVFTHLMFIQMFDDNVVSLTALTRIVYPKCRPAVNVGIGITQVTLSLYLMTQCQLMLRHSVTSLVHTLDCIEVARIKHRADRTLDHLILKMTKRKILTYITWRRSNHY